MVVQSSKKLKSEVDNDKTYRKVKEILIILEANPSSAELIEKPINDILAKLIVHT